jgi:hypothetical protein
MSMISCIGILSHANVMSSETGILLSLTGVVSPLLDVHPLNSKIQSAVTKISRFVLIKINCKSAVPAHWLWRSEENQLGERPSGKGREHPPRRAKKNFPLSTSQGLCPWTLPTFLCQDKKVGKKSQDCVRIAQKIVRLPAKILITRACGAQTARILIRRLL